jgi:hypothetical protein
MHQGEPRPTREPREPKELAEPVQQTYPEGYDFRQSPEGLRTSLLKVMNRVNRIDKRVEDLDAKILYDELRLMAAEARLLQTQCSKDTQEWETVVQIIKALTRIASDRRPGYIYGLASSHNTDWGAVILDVLKDYVPLDTKA